MRLEQVCSFHFLIFPKPQPCFEMSSLGVEKLRYPNTLGVYSIKALFSVVRSLRNYCPRFCSTGKKDASNWNLLLQKLYCLHLQEQERKWQNPVPFKENYPPPRTCRSLIGCSPLAELSSWGRQSTWSEELPLAHAQIICLPLRTQDVSAIL